MIYKIQQHNLIKPEVHGGVTTNSIWKKFYIPDEIKTITKLKSNSKGN